MRIIKEIDLMQKITATDDFNFLAFAYTPWHAHGIQAVLEKLKNEGFKVVGLICICKHLDAGFLLDDIFGGYKLENVEVCYYIEEYPPGMSHIKEYFQQLFFPIKKNGRKIILVLPNHFSAMRYVRLLTYINEGYIHNYIIDEGLASYMRNESAFYEKPIHKCLLKKIWFYVRTRFLDKIYICKIEKAGLICDFRLLKKQNMGLNVNEESIYFYKQAINEGSCLGNEMIDTSIYEDVIIINTQPFWDEKNVNNNCDINIIYELCKNIYSMGINIILKPHPREQCLERYDILKKYVKIDMNKEVSQERILSKLKKKPLAIIAFSSTTLVSAQLLFDVKTYSIVQFWNRSNISRELFKEQQVFYDTFSSMIVCPKNMDELLCLLKANKI